MADHQTPSNVRVSADEMGWVTELTLEDGAIVTKWFETEEAARRYPLELAAWLRRKDISAARRMSMSRPDSLEGERPGAGTRTDRYRHR